MSFDFLFQISIRNTVLDREKCNCSSDSLCVSIVHNRSIYLCVPHNDRISLTNFTYACQDGFSGKRCEYEDVKIDILFYDISIPQSLLVHFITVREHVLESLNSVPIRATMFKKIRFDQDTITFFMSLPFHLIIVQLEDKFYLTVPQHIYTPSVTIQTKIARSQYCPYIRELFNQTLIAYPILRRIKYYHHACMKDSNLVCFHDNELFICLYTEEKHANCRHLILI
ncbi:unnamed protein product [Rotaria magnacalcarata]|uniref:EGF-like domain-containing protein n=1 Tax=Rotaria magnacalcarata TaxID=392030 RepID=A0A820QC72_9BILA|nr:unnamed protein product [Rotaria magnacalcarata]CAF4418041.1 unnamed protein product [Rotaria magnacalcarata]